jgi:hypothetical protein
MRSVTTAVMTQAGIARRARAIPNSTSSSNVRAKPASASVPAISRASALRTVAVAKLQFGGEVTINERERAPLLLATFISSTVHFISGVHPRAARVEASSTEVPADLRFANTARVEYRNCLRVLRAAVRTSSLSGSAHRPSGLLFASRQIIGNASVAQLDRASASGAEGHRFESCQAH